MPAFQAEESPSPDKSVTHVLIEVVTYVLIEVRVFQNSLARRAKIATA